MKITPKIDVIKNSIERLSDDDLNCRTAAREKLISLGKVTIPFLENKLEDCEGPTSPLYYEISRIRDWIKYKVDPEWIRSMLRIIDPQSKSHGNAFGGIESAIREPNQFNILINKGETIHAFLEKIIIDEKEPFSLRAVSTLIIGDIECIVSIPKLLEAFKSEHKLLYSKENDIVHIRESYRGFFLYTLQKVLSHLSEEHFPTGIIEDITGVYEYGAPRILYIYSICEIALVNWETWWNVFGKRCVKQNAEEFYTTEHINDLINKILQSKNPEFSYERYRINRIGSKADKIIAKTIQDSSIDSEISRVFMKMIIWNRTDPVISESDQSVLLLSELLKTFENPIEMRLFIKRVINQLPCSLFKAIANILPSNRLATDNLALFNPFILYGFDGIISNSIEASTTVIDSICEGIASSNRKVRYLFFDIAEGYITAISRQSDLPDTNYDSKVKQTNYVFYNKEFKEKKLEKYFISKLEQISIRFNSNYDRLLLRKLQSSLGNEVNTYEIIDLLNIAKEQRDQPSFIELCSLVDLRKIEDKKKEDLADLFIHALVIFPEHQDPIKEALKNLLPDYFAYYPELSSKCFNSFIRIYTLRKKSKKRIDKNDLEQEIKSIREEVSNYHRNKQLFLKDSGSSIINICISVAKEFNLGYELYKALKLKAFLTSDKVYIQKMDEKYDSVIMKTNYIKQLDNESYITSFDITAAYFSSAASVAKKYKLPNNEYIDSILAQGYAALNGNRPELALKIAKKAYKQIKDHFDHSILCNRLIVLALLMKGLWSYALDAIYELLETFNQNKQLTPEQYIIMLDSYHDKAYCMRKLGYPKRALEILSHILPYCEKTKQIWFSYKIQLETSITLIELGQLKKADKLLSEIEQMTNTDLHFQKYLCIIYADLLRYRAKLNSLVGNIEEGINSLKKAFDHYGNFVVYFKFDNSERLALDYFDCGKMYLSIGDMFGALKILQSLKSIGLNPIVNTRSSYVQLCTIRLQASIMMAQGRYAAAIDLYKDNLYLLDHDLVPEMKINMCLELIHMFIQQGHIHECYNILAQGETIAEDSIDPNLLNHIYLTRANLYNNQGKHENAKEIFDSLINEMDKENKTDIWYAVNIQKLLTDFVCGFLESQLKSSEILKFASQINDKNWRINLMCTAALVFLKHELPNEAYYIMNFVEEQMKQGISLHLLYQYKVIKSMLAEQSNETELAITLLQDSIHIIELIRSANISYGLGTGLLRTEEEPYNRLILLLLDKGQIIDALYYTERIKSRFLKDQIHWIAANDNHNITNLQNYFQICSRLAYYELCKQQNQSHVQDSEIDQLNTERRKIENEIGVDIIMKEIHPSLFTPQTMMQQIYDTINIET